MIGFGILMESLVGGGGCRPGNDGIEIVYSGRTCRMNTNRSFMFRSNVRCNVADSNSVEFIFATFRVRAAYGIIINSKRNHRVAKVHTPTHTSIRIPHTTTAADNLQ